MKKIAENRYPHSATLFKFCKEALSLRYQGNVKVIDQDVGAILGYDPADCSHWKKGKKNIRALQTLKNIAEYLNVDEKLLIDIAAGKIDLDEAIFEFRGYGHFSLNPQSLDLLKKEYFKNPERWQKNGYLPSFEELFQVSRKDLFECAADILKLGNFTEAPIYLPEIISSFKNIKVLQSPEFGDCITVDYEGEGRSTHVTIKCRSETRPYVRFLIAKELFKFLCISENDVVKNFLSSPKEVREIQGNILAGMLLIPTDLLRAEVDRITSSVDLVQQLADTFWVSKSLMNQRLRDYMENMD